MLAPCLLALALIPTADPKPRLDADGIPLPAEAVRRFGSAKFCTDPPRSVAFSPDGKTAYLVPVRISLWRPDAQPALSAWEVSTGRMVWAFVDPKLVGQQVAVDPDGKTVWLAGRIGDGKPQETTAVRVKLSAGTGKELDRTVLRNSWSDALDLRPDGTLAWNRLDVKENDLTLRFLKPDGTDAVGWDPVGQAIGLIKHSPDGKLLFVGGRAYESRGWKLTAVDVASGRAKWTVDTPMQDTLAVSPDGKVVAVVLSGDPPPNPQRVPNPIDERPEKTKVVGYRTATGAEIGAVDVGDRYFRTHRDYGPTGGGRPLSFTPNGKELLTQNDDWKTVVIDPETWKVSRDLRTDAEAYGWRTPVGKAFLAPVSWHRNLILCDTATRQPVNPPPLLQRGESGRGVGIVFSSGGERLLYGGHERERVEWEVTTGKELARVPWDKLKDQPTANPRDKVVWKYGTFLSPDGKLVYRSIRGTDRNDRHGEVVDATTKRQVADLALKGWIRPLAFSADSKQVIGVDQGKVGVWQVAAGGEPATVEGSLYFTDYGGDENDNLLLDPTANRVVVTEKDDRTRRNREAGWRIWRYDLDPLKLSARWEGLGRLKDVAYTRDGRLVGRFRPEKATPYWAESVFVITPDAEVPITFAVDAGGSGFAVSPDGRTVAFGTPGGDIHLYELAAGKRRHTFVGLQRAATSLVFSPDGRLLASESADGPVLLWDVRGDVTKPAKPDAIGWGRAWDALGGEDTVKAFQAIRLFAFHPDDGAAELKKRFAEVKTPTAKVCERAVEAMQLAGTEAARKVIAEWAKGPADDVLTKAASGK
jgi:WD40 repeat protein